MFATSAMAWGWMILGLSVLTGLSVLAYAYVQKITHPECYACKNDCDYAPMGHDPGCPVRLAAFGGDPNWDQDELQTDASGKVFYFRKDWGTWVPQSRV